MAIREEEHETSGQLGLMQSQAISIRFESPLACAHALRVHVSELAPP